jgi:hypothetical protein
MVPNTKLKINKNDENNNNEKQTHLDVRKCSKPLQTFVDKHSKKEKNHSIIKMSF